MNSIMAHSAIAFAGAQAVNPARAPANIPLQPVASVPRFTIAPMLQPPLPASLPLAATASGNLFLDRNDASLHWYLPQFNLAADVDPNFAFVASQSGQQDGEGHPLNVAQVTLQVVKSRPADVAQFALANPGAKLQEIPLAGLTAVLSSSYTDQNGQPQQRTFNSTSLQDLGNGSFLLTFGSIIGFSVLGLYQDLRMMGKAVIILSASYQAWVKPGTPLPPSNLRLRLLPLVPLQAVAAGGTTLQPPPRPMPNLLNGAPINNVSPAPAVPVNPGAPQNPPAPPPLVQMRQSWGAALPLGLKYNLDGYQLRYTVSSPTVAGHVILTTADLGDFNQSQTEFAELKALGNLNFKYPSVSRAYFGVLSRTIVLIPQRYAIVRGKTGCAATCLARVDSSAASGSQCLFELSFTLAPDVSRIELARLQQEISRCADFNGYQITFPSFVRDTPPSTLQTAFQTSAQFDAGADPHTFALTVTVRDDGPKTPAVVDANLFILQLIAQTGTDLTGSLSLKLDEGYPNPVLAMVDLNFQHTVGTDELLVELDPAGAVINVTNQSPLDLQFSEYALISGANLAEFPGVINLAAHGTTALPLPANNSGLQFAAAAQLALPNPMSLSAVTQFLNFTTVDVQNTQYLVAIDGSGLDFARVASVSVNITFASLPNAAPRQLQLSGNIRADSTNILIPLVNAMFSLPGTVAISVQWVDSTVNPVLFTLQNEFVAKPILYLLQTDIDSHLAKS
jgi:hypothetical protein